MTVKRSLACQRSRSAVPSRRAVVDEHELHVGSGRRREVGEPAGVQPQRLVETRDNQADAIVHTAHTERPGTRIRRRARYRQTRKSQSRIVRITRVTGCPPRERPPAGAVLPALARHARQPDLQQPDGEQRRVEVERLVDTEPVAAKHVAQPLPPVAAEVPQVTVVGREQELIRRHGDQQHAVRPKRPPRGRQERPLVLDVLEYVHHDDAIECRIRQIVD